MSDFKNNVKSLLFSKVTGNHGNRVGRESIDEAIHATHGGWKSAESCRNAPRHWLQIELLRNIVPLRRPSEPSGKIAGASASAPPDYGSEVVLAVPTPDGQDEGDCEGVVFFVFLDFFPAMLGMSVHANCKPMKPCGLRREGMLRAQEILHECLGNTSPSDTKEESLSCIFLRMGMEECIGGRTEAGSL